MGEEELQEALRHIDDASTEMSKAKAKLDGTEHEEKARELRGELTELFNEIYEG